MAEYINKLRLRPDRIFKAEKLLIKLPANNRVFHIMLAAHDDVAILKSDMERLKFVPNVPRALYIPKFDLNPINFRKRNKTALREKKFSDLRKEKVRFKKLLNPMDEKVRSLKEPLILDLALFRKAFNDYAIKRNKKPPTLINQFNQVLDSIKAEISLGFVVDLYVPVEGQNDPFMETLLYMMRSKSKDVFTSLSTLNVIFFSRDGYFYKADFTDITKKSRIIGFINKLIKVSSLPAEEVAKDKDIDSEPLVTAAEKKLVVSAEDDSALETDDDDTLDIDDLPDLPADSEDELEIVEPEDQVSLPDELESFDDSEVPELDLDGLDAEDLPVDDALVAALESDDDDEDFLIPELEELQVGNEALLKLEEENREFLEKNLAIQEKALAKFEVEADKALIDKNLDPVEITDPNILNESMRTSSMNSITNSYYVKQYKRDILDCIKGLNDDPEYPMVITDMQVNDSSDALNKTNELVLKFKDKRNKTHTFKVNVPTLSHDGFLMFGGNKKFIAKQITPIPVIKEAEDRVQITTNYRKAFLYRKGDKSSGQADRLLRLFGSGGFEAIETVSGDSVNSNLGNKLSLTYTYLSSRIFNLKIKQKETDTEFFFNQNKVKEVVKLKDFNLAPDQAKYAIIGIIKDKKGTWKEFILESRDDSKIHVCPVGTDKVRSYSSSLTELLTNMVNSLTEEAVVEKYNSLKVSKSLSFSEIKIAGTSLPVGVLIAFYKGLLTSLDDYGIKYSFSDKRRAPSISEVQLAFKDGYIYVDSEFVAHKELFVNGLAKMDMKEYTVNQTHQYSDVYLDYLELTTSSRNNAKALMNFQASMIDAITLETLAQHNLPTTFPELVVYANTLLGDYERHRKNDVNFYRIRDSEVLAVAVYNALMDSFNSYKRGARNGLYTGMITNPNAVISNIQSMSNVEDYSTLNPYQEAEVKAKATFKGPSGLIMVHYKLP